MNIKKIKIITSIAIILIMLSIQISYAISGLNNNSFFTVNLDKIEQNETLKILFNLNKIEYENFKIVLNSNIDNNKIHTANNITVKEEANSVVIEIDKTKMNLESIEMSYVVPEETEVNSQIQLSAKVIIQEEIEQKDDEGNINFVKQEKTVLDESKNITVIEKKENENIDDENNSDTNKESNNSKEENKDVDNVQQGKNNIDNKNEPSDIKNNNNSMTNTGKTSNNNKSEGISMASTSKNTNSILVQSNKNVETATYNGSNNNYLNSLKVKDLDLNTDFNKENTTYFIKVTDTSSINITATAEDSTAKVAVTGYESIKEGINKILVAVTAENGNIRYYRIFVNCVINN